MPVVYSDPSTGKYHTPGHPEAPFRVLKTAQRLRAAGLAPVAPDVRASEQDALLVHTPRHLDAVRKGSYIDADTPHYPGIFDVAMTSLSGALSAAAQAVQGVPAFSLMRPPGHHAAPETVAGFCYLNNVAIACAKAGKRVAIVDVDVHHGDGTEAWALGRENVLFCSLHQVPLYPGTGTQSRDNCLNFPIEAGTDERGYLPVLVQALERAAAFKPDLLAVSAGFDTYKECPIAGLKLGVSTYKTIGRLLAEMKTARFAVLEGGYAEDVPLLVERFLDGFFG